MVGPRGPGAGKHFWLELVAEPHCNAPVCRCLWHYAKLIPVTAHYYADGYQQYLAKHVNGYRCHANTGVPFPTDA